MSTLRDKVPDNPQIPPSPSQAAEWFSARTALLCAPHTETLFALLAMDAMNFLHPFSLLRARQEHAAYGRALTAHGVEVIDLREALTRGCEEKGEALDRLRGWAGQAARHEFDANILEEDRVLCHSGSTLPAKDLRYSPLPKRISRRMRPMASL